MELPAISFSGLATGIDSDKMIKQLVQIEQLPIRRLEARKAAYDKQAKKLTDVKNKMDALKDAAAALDSAREVLTSKTVVADDSVATASAEGGASLGKYTLATTTLAKEERTYSDGFASKTQTGLLGSGSFSITIDGDTTQIDVTASDTLETIASKINGSAAEVTAGIIYDGSSYYLQVRGNESGAANAITFVETGTTLGFNTAGNEKQAAADASFTVDGISMSRSSNVISDAIPGVTLTLLAEGASTTLEIQRDPAALQSLLNDFISKYNAVQTTINGEFAFLGEARGLDSLAGDSTLRGIQGRLRTIVTGAVSGLSGPYSALSQIGVESNTDGTLKLNADTLAEVVANNADAVADVLIDNLETGSQGIMPQLQAAVTEFARSGDGTLVARVMGLGNRKDSVDEQIDRMSRRVDDFEARLTEQFAQLEQLVSGLQAQSQQMMAMLSSL
ncbi:MAG: flagellar filament capping protein FliD [Proteobacteria bacterium]|nr:flagellar filament capping protein FliD [Pseudomonadota bacterium]